MKKTLLIIYFFMGYLGLQKCEHKHNPISYYKEVTAPKPKVVVAPKKRPFYASLLTRSKMIWGTIIIITSFALGYLTGELWQ